MSESDVDGLLESLPGRVDALPWLVREGRFMDADFLLEIGSRSFYLAVRAGRLLEVARGPLRMRSWAFAIRAPEESWRRFWEPLPAPGFNDVFAMARHGHARIEGDVGPLLANLRYVKELLALPRVPAGGDR